MDEAVAALLSLCAKVVVVVVVVTIVVFTFPFSRDFGGLVCGGDTGWLGIIMGEMVL